GSGGNEGGWRLPVVKKRSVSEAGPGGQPKRRQEELEKVGKPEDPEGVQRRSGHRRHLTRSGFLQTTTMDPTETQNRFSG
uniref:Uncharacterized protein n=1 Tax=Spermophilus dauricus TaxID=99837 RepID=A0A8C9NZJ9_SPEDA